MWGNPWEFESPRAHQVTSIRAARAARFHISDGITRVVGRADHPPGCPNERERSAVDVDVRDHGGSRYTVHVSLDKGEVNNAFNKTYQQLSDRGGIRGFRPGKVPRKILDRYYEEDVIRAVTYEDLIQSRLETAMEEQNLRPIDQLDVQHGTPPDDDEELAARIKSGLVEDEEEDAEEFEEAAEEAVEEAVEDPEEALEETMEDIPLQEGEPFEFYASFTAYPRPELPDLSDLKLMRPVSEVTDEEVDQRLEELRRINAEEVETDRDQIAESDLVVVDIKIVLEDEEADEVEPRQEEIIVGERDYIGNIDDELVGHEPGDIVEVEYTFEDDHPDESLAGNTATIIAEIDSFSARELPELDDEFAQSLGDYEDLDELMSSIREQLQAERDREADEELRSQVLRHILENTEVELPEQFVEEAADRSLDDLRDELQQTGMSLEEFAEANDVDEDELRESQRARALSSLKLHFALQALAQEREVEATEEDVTAELQRIAAQAGGDMSFVQQAAALQPNFMDEVQDRVLRRILLEDIIESAEIEEIGAEEYEEFVAEVSGSDEDAEESSEEAEVVADGAEMNEGADAGDTVEEPSGESDEADESYTSNQDVTSE
ncbi:MAG: trigger factor [Armatimonadia bacterium]|nr:trigger factor [Armatimonadia bacterium]